MHIICNILFESCNLTREKDEISRYMMICAPGIKRSRTSDITVAITLDKRWKSRQRCSRSGNVIDNDVTAVETKCLLSAGTANVAVVQAVRVEVTTVSVGPRPRVLNVAVGVVVCERHCRHSPALGVTVRRLWNATDVTYRLIWHRTSI